jgi:RNA recognition motif-containing protein
MPIYLEFAPEGFINENADVESSQDSEAEEQDLNEKVNREKTVFIKNLNFTTTEEQIEEVFKISNLKGKVLSVKIVRRSDN